MKDYKVKFYDAILAEEGNELVNIIFEKEMVLEEIKTESYSNGFNNVKHFYNTRNQHICRCGNLTNGTQNDKYTKGLLCEECRSVYGHYHEEEL